MSLETDLITIQEREKSATADRYDYQAMCGLALLFEVHGQSHDYAVVFEFHDDIALLDSASTPKNVKFFQVKSSSTKGDWKLSQLIYRSKSTKDGKVVEKLSYIDKMYDNINKFNNSVISVDFVSNKPSTLGKEKASFRFSECKPEDFAKIVKSVRMLYPNATEAEIGLLGFEHTNLSLQDVASHTRGKLQTFIAQHLGDVRFSPEALYKAVVDEVRRKSNFKGSHATLADAVRNKGLTTKNVQAWLDAVAKDSRSPEWSEIAPDLSYPFAETLAISKDYAAYRPAALNSGDKALHRVRLAIRANLSGVIDDVSLNLSEMIDAIARKVNLVAEKYITPFSISKFRAMIIYEIYTRS